jgi:hypothetical protein
MLALFSCDGSYILHLRLYLGKALLHFPWQQRRHSEMVLLKYGKNLMKPVGFREQKKKNFV